MGRGVRVASGVGVAVASMVGVRVAATVIRGAGIVVVAVGVEGGPCSNQSKSRMPTMKASKFSALAATAFSRSSRLSVTVSNVATSSIVSASLF